MSLDNTPFKIAVVGAGSVGGYVGGNLALAGEDVTFIARGESLKALRQGFTLIDPAGTHHKPPVKAAAIDEAGTFDLVILGLKAQQIGAVAPALGNILGPKTPIIALQNGVPWWYFHKSGGAFEGHRIAAVDPGGRIFDAIDPVRVIGGVIYVASTVPAPGVVHFTETNRIVLGEPDGSLSPRVEDAAARLNRAGVKAVVSQTIRTDIWTKLWGNLALNPVSALTRGGLSDIIDDPATRKLVAAIMAEAEQVAAHLGVRMSMTIDERIAVTRKLGRHKTSTLQDIEAGRPPELDALVAAVTEFARMGGIATPYLDAIHACTDLLARMVTGHTAPRA
ncbi:MAG: 2-dehydropantoate 2-reductase [Rhodospirillaceae bacterium]|nr:2-dehydropantoate 2-reductase [Rhodospirillaceae bacterium]